MQIDLLRQFACCYLKNYIELLIKEHLICKKFIKWILFDLFYLFYIIFIQILIVFADNFLKFDLCCNFI